MFEILLILLIQLRGDTVYNLRDFRLPDAGTIRLEISGGVLLDGYQSMRDYDTLTRYSNNLEVNGLGSARFDLLRLSETRFIELNAVTNPFLNEPVLWVHGHGIQYIPDSSDESSQDWSLHLTPRIDASTYAGWYFGDSPWFLGFKDTIDIRWDVWNFDWNTWTRIGYIWKLGVFIGGGVGRVRNVAPVSKAWQFLDGLNQADKGNIDDLATLLSTQWKYELNHWYHEKYFYPDLEKLLKEQGVVERLTPYQTMRLREIVLGIPQERLSGNRFFAGVGMTELPWYYHAPFDNWYGLYFDVVGGYPVSRRWQLDWNVRGGVFTTEFTDIEYAFEGEGMLTFFVNERSAIGTGLEGFHWNIFSNYPRRGAGASIPVELSIFIEDKVSLSANLYYFIGINQEGSFYSVAINNVGFEFLLSWWLL